MKIYNTIKHKILMERYLESKLSSKIINLKLIKEGYNHKIFSFTTKGKKLIAHQSKKRAHSGSSLMNTYKILKFLQSQKIEFVPKAIFYDPKEKILVQTFVGEKHVPLNKLNNKLIRKIAKQLYQIHSLDYKKYQKFCEKNNLSIPKIEDPKQELKTYGVDRFEEAKKSCPSEEVLFWIESRLRENQKIIKNAKRKTRPHILLGNIGEDITINNEETRAWFIDWEFSRIGYGTELTYIKIHSHLNDKQLKILYERYYKHLGGKSTKKFPSERIIRLNDVIWATMMWGREKNDKQKAKKYELLTKKRIKLFKECVSKF